MRRGMKKEALFFIVILTVVLLAGLAFGSLFEDKTSNDFNNGTYTNTSYNGTGVILNGGNTSGTFTSRIFDATTPSRWDNMSSYNLTPSLDAIYAVDVQANVYLSQNLGVSWSFKSQYSSTFLADTQDIFSDSSNNLYVIKNTRREVYRSNNSGSTWFLINGTFANKDLYTGTSYGNVIYVFGATGVGWKSSDYGLTWSSITDFNGASNNNPIGSAVNSTGAIYAVDSSGAIYSSLNNGSTWSLKNSSYGRTTDTQELFSANDSLYIISSVNKEVWKSSDYGVTWTVINNTFSSLSLLSASSDSKGNIYVVAGTSAGIVYRSSNNGSTWSQVNASYNGGNGASKGLTYFTDTTNLSFQAKNCSWANCSDGVFQAVNLSNMNLTGRYFQYRVNFTSQDVSLTPILYNTSIGYSILDNQAPNLAIISPLNQSYTDATILVNISSSDSSGISQTWFNNGTANVSYFSPTNYVFPQGSNTVIAYSNDTLGNLNSSRITFFVDSVAPSVTIYSPQNTTYNSSSIFLNYSASDVNGISACKYSRDSNSNISLAGCSTATLTGFSDGGHDVIIYSNDSYGNLNSSRIYFSVDTTPPLWSNVQSSVPGSYAQQSSYFNVSWSDSSGISSVLFESNFSGSNQNYSMNLISGSVYGFNATLSAGTFYWKSYSNDTLGNLNSSSTQVFTINKASNSVDIYLNGNKNQNLTVSYGNQTNVTAIALAGSLSLYKNNVLISNPEIGILAANSTGYFYNATSNGNQNYTSNSSIIVLFVSKTQPSLNLLINSSSGNLSIVYGNTSNATSYESNLGDSDLVYNFYRNGAFISSGSSLEDVGVLASGNYTYTYNTSGGGNYTSSSLSRNLEILKASPKMGLTLNGSSSDISIPVNTILDVNASLSTPSLESAYLYEDSVLILSGSSIDVQKNYTSLGNRVWAEAFYGNENYSAQNISYTVSVIDSNSPQFSNIKNNVSSPATYAPNKTYQFNITWIDNIGISDVVFRFNNTNYSYSLGQVQKNGNEYYINLSSLSVGTYIYKWFANDTSNNFVSTQNQTYVVDKEIAALFLTMSPSNNIVYGTFSSVSCSANNAESSLSLTRNATVVSNPDGNSLAVGVYNYACTSIATQNYTSASTTSSLTVSKASPVINLTLNGIDGNLSLSPGGGLVAINATLATPLSGVINLTLDGVLISSGNSSVQNSTSISSSGNHIISAVFGGDENYSSITFSRSVFVNQPSSSSQSQGSGGGSSVKGLVISNKPSLDVSTIQPLILDEAGVKKIVSWNVVNNGPGFLNDCTFKSTGAHSDWISKTETKGLAAGEQYTFVFDVNIPENLEKGNYSVDVLLDCREINSSVSFIVELKGKQIDLKLTDVKRIDKTNISVSYTIQDLTGKDQNATLQFLIFDPNNKKEAEVKETKFIPAGSLLSFTTIIPIRSDLSGELSLLINLNSETYSSFVQENIVLGKSVSGFSIFSGQQSTNTFISAFIVILFLFFAFFIVKRIRKHRRLIRGHHLKERYSSMLSAY